MDESMTYIGRADCGCIRFAVVDDPNLPKETSKSVAYAIRRGLYVERVKSSAVREMSWWCKKHPKPPRQGKLLPDPPR
jgi:hypothetical protein